MPRPFRFALQAMHLSDPVVVQNTAIEAEQLGYCQLFSFDHVGAVDPFVPLMIAATAAPGLHVGPLVLNNELHHPALLARTAATVDRLTNGRLILGLGTGYMNAEHDAIGSPLRQPGPRVRRFAESLAVLRDLLDDGRSSFDGEFHHLALDDLGIRPKQAHVPFLIGGHGALVVRLAARYADIFQFTGLTHGPGGVLSPGGFALADVRRRAEWLAESAGDRVGDIERSALVQVTHVGHGAGEVVAGLVEQFSVSRELIDETPFILVGSLDQIVDKLERLRADLDINHLVVRDATGFAPVVDVLNGR